MTVRLVGRGDPTRVITDLLFASSGIEAEVVALADDIEIIPGLTLPVARTGHLIAMKLLARDDRRRPADADDLRALAEVASKADWDLAEAACRQIVDLGYGRGRDLVSLLVDVRMSN